MAAVDGLSVERLDVRFGGVTAVDGLGLNAPRSRLTGLIGPNGAGKTTTFNACTGLIRPAAGRITLFGHDATRWSSARRAQHGLGRTFQRMELFDVLTVRENVALGREARLAGSRARGQLWSSKAERADVAEAADVALSLCGLEPLAGEVVSVLSTGHRRLVELARALASGCSILLLDEPSSGLDNAETKRFGDILCSVVRELGHGILLVEHDMSLVSEICDYIYVLDFGRLICEGATHEVLASEVVRSAYLGTEVAHA